MRPPARTWIAGGPLLICGPGSSYDVPAPLATMISHYDLVNGIYVLLSHPGEYYGVKHPAPRLSTFWTPDSLAGTSIR